MCVWQCSFAWDRNISWRTGQTDEEVSQDITPLLRKRLKRINSHCLTPFYTHTHIHCFFSGGFGCCLETRSNSRTSAPGHPDLHLYQTEVLYHSSLLLGVPQQHSPANKRLFISFVWFYCWTMVRKAICFEAVATLGAVGFWRCNRAREMDLFSSRCQDCCLFLHSVHSHPDIH